MFTIQVTNLIKYFLVYKRKSDFFSAFRSLLHREMIEVKAVDDISFSIKQGELVGFIGPNGAGKTTTLKCLSGLLFPSKGEVSVLGFTPSQRRKEFLSQISLVMGQKNQLWWDLPSLDTFRLHKEIYDISDSEFKYTLDELVKLLEVENLLSVPVRQLSLGQRMKLELIASLIHRPKVLFLDEPTIGLDVVMQKKIRDFIIAYNRKYNATILLTSHYMKDVKEMCKRVIVIDHGKIIYDGKLDKLVARFAFTKLITVILSKEVAKKEFMSLGEIRTYEKDKVTLSVAKQNIKDTATRILTKYPVEDLTIEEPDIEEIIRLVFSKKHRYGKI